MKKYSFLISFFILFSLKAQQFNKFDAQQKRHGIWQKKYDNGKIRYQGEFKHGKEVGVFKFYTLASSKHPVIIKTFNESDNIAAVKFYAKNGTLESTGNMSAKNRIGKWFYYHKNGKTIMQEENYLDNKLNGDFKTFYSNAKPTLITVYKDGKIDGNYKRYSVNNFLYEDLNYNLGKLNGLAAYYNRKTGKIIEKGNFVNGEKIGVWEFYIDGFLSERKEIIKSKK